MDNQIRYDNERARRWDMARDGEEAACSAVAQQIANIVQVPVTFQRYDVEWFSVFPPETCDWVRGCSDYVLWWDAGYLYAEIKIKAQRYHKTVTGGITKRGSSVARYGCESFYLDVEPVYTNMCEFTKRTGIPEESFLLFFVSEDHAQIMSISLAEVRSLVTNGWHGIPLSVFAEGYGHPAYLIPVDACHTLTSATSDWCISCCTPDRAAPRTS